MEKLDIRPIIAAAKKTVEKHELGEKGAYCRWLWGGTVWGGNSAPRDLGKNEYGCADAANILYTINEFYCDDETRNARIRELQAMQNPETGMFNEVSHHPIHTTAHCLAALQLFDAKPLYPVTALHKYYNKVELYKLLDGLNWKADPWSNSHQGAGVYAALVNADEMTEDFQKNYFDWFWENASPELGFWKTGYIEKATYSSERAPEGQASVFNYMAGGFHYMFNHEYAKMPLRYPERVIDSCIKMYRENGLPDYFAKRAGFIEIDWIYCINRASRQTDYRNAEVRELIEDFAKRMYDNFINTDYEKDDMFNDLHMLFGTMCAFAEMQEALPCKIITEKPLRLVLDRRPFI